MYLCQFGDIYDTDDTDDAVLQYTSYLLSVAVVDKPIAVMTCKDIVKKVCTYTDYIGI